MRKVELNINEQYKYGIIKNFVDTNGNKKNAAIKLNYIVRTVNPLIIKYNAEGKTDFIHKIDIESLLQLFLMMSRIM